MTEAKRAAIYLRISKKPDGEEDAEASHSVEDQRQRCEALCDANGYTVVATCVDDGVSAYRLRKNRLGYAELKAAVEDRSFDVLVFDRQDRLGRNQRETMRFIADCGDAGIGWHSQQEGVIDLDDTFSVLRAIFKGTEAQEYSSKISTNSRERNKMKRDQGLPGAGGRPFGWTKAERATDYRQSLVADEADLVKRGTSMILSGASTYQVAKAFRDSGVKTVRGKEWVPANVAAVLRRWRNAGWVEHDDKPHQKAIWPAIVTKEDVEGVRAILDQGRIAGRWRTPTMLCSGIARCHCGLTLMVTGNDGVTAYRCSGIINRPDGFDPSEGHVTIRAALLDPVVRDAVVDAYFTRPASSLAGKVEAASLSRLRHQQAALQKKRRRVQSDREVGIYSRSEAAEKIISIEAQFKDLNAQAATLVASSAHAAMLEESLNAMVADLDVDVPAHDAETGEFHAGVALVQSAMRDGATRDDALNSLANAKWWDTDESGQPVRKVDPAVREAVARRFDSMDLEPRRDLTRSLVTITINPGRGVEKRVSVEPVERAAAVPV